MKLMLTLLVASFLFTVQAPQVAEKNAPAKIAVTSKEEPGERLIVTGRVLGPDGKTPISGVSLYVYQTDKQA